MGSPVSRCSTTTFSPARADNCTREIAPGGRTVPGSDTVTQQPVAGTGPGPHDRPFDPVRLRGDPHRAGRPTSTQGVASSSCSTPTPARSSRTRRSAGTTSTDELEVTRGNFVATDSYEPGSVAKVITVAGALDDGCGRPPSTTFEVPWREQYYDDLLKDSHQHADRGDVGRGHPGRSRRTSARSRSSRRSVASVHHDYMTSFGLGEATALDFPGESPGIFKDADDLWGSERVTVVLRPGRCRARRCRWSPRSTPSPTTASTSPRPSCAPPSVRTARSPTCRRRRATASVVRPKQPSDHGDDAGSGVQPDRAQPHVLRSTACRSPARPAPPSRRPTTAPTSTRTATGSTTPASPGSSPPTTRR